MKRLLKKIWMPALLVSIAALQSFGTSIYRSAGHAVPADCFVSGMAPDSLNANAKAQVAVKDSLERADSSDMAADSISYQELVLSARDTISVPDSLRETDPLKYKYYIALRDSVTRFQIRDSLMQAGDSLELHRLDSLYIKDSTDIAQAAFAAWYASLSKRERKQYDYKQALPAKIAALNRKMQVKDSIRAYKDSITEATPRILETFAIADSLKYKRIITWKHDRYFHNLEIQKFDTSYNSNAHDYPFFKEDVNATWLGVIGSPVQLYDYFKRRDEANAVFYTPYSIYSYSPETLPQYNTKTPYTELAYWGTLFANKEKEESNIKVLTTQNITPELNILLEYKRFGSNGMLRREDTGNRDLVAATNYMGKRYLMHAGFIYNKINKSENGGVQNTFWLRDTTVDAREIEVYLKNADNKLKKNTVFLDQSYRIPFSFIDKIKDRKEAKKRDAVLDSIMASGDSLAIQAFMLKGEQGNEESGEEKPEVISKDITTAFIGHSSEYSVFRKTYTDNIGSSDAAGREFFNDRFYLNPTKSADSLRVMRFENRFFLRLQPWKNDGIVSKLDVGLGDKLANYYSFKPDDYLRGADNIVQNSVYLYAGANGQFKKYFTWKAKGYYDFLGYEINDFGIDADLSFSAYPFRRDKNSPLKLDVHFETNLKEPDYYQQHLYTNHYRWDNDFGKISTTKLQASLAIPRWDLHASFGYGLLGNNIYYDTLGVARQNGVPMSVMTASLRKDVRIWKFHLDNQALFQLSSNSDALPLPMLALNLRYYFQFDVVKDAMQMQIGANGTFTTSWYAPAYNPVLGVFHNQNKEKFGNCPYIDVFVNIQWKTACLFVKVVNVNMGWPNKSADYFTAAGYIGPQRTVKFGIMWPFYVHPGRSIHSSGAGSAGRGAMNGSGSGQGSSNLPAGLSSGGRSGAQKGASLR